MLKVIVIVGLPGSGKTIYGNSLSNSLNYLFVDDCLLNNLSWNEVVENITNNQNLIVSHPSFCLESIRNTFINKIKDINKECEIDFLYFENDIDTCIKNVSKRKDNRYISIKSIKALSKEYVIPSKANILKCWRGDSETQNA